MADEPNEYIIDGVRTTTSRTMCVGCCELSSNTKRNSDGEQMCPTCLAQMP